MPHLSRRLFGLSLVAVAVTTMTGCGRRRARAKEMRSVPLYPNETPELRRLINQYADLYDIPRPLMHRVIVRESTHRPEAINRPYYGLMQILPETARTMGFRGKPRDLLDAETNLKYAGKYLRGAWLLSDGSYDAAVKHYSRGYYYEAKRRGMLKETGLVN